MTLKDKYSHNILSFKGQKMEFTTFPISEKCILQYNLKGQIDQGMFICFVEANQQTLRILRSILFVLIGAVSLLKEIQYWRMAAEFIQPVIIYTFPSSKLYLLSLSGVLVCIIRPMSTALMSSRVCKECWNRKKSEICTKCISLMHLPNDLNQTHFIASSEYCNYRPPSM